jgi:type IV secretion system pilin
MGLLSATSITVLADTTSPTLAASTMRSFVDPVVTTMGVVATLLCAVLIVMGGYRYMTSSGKPDDLQQAKKIIKNALIGLVIVLSAGVLTALLTHAYGNVASPNAEKIPSLTLIQPKHVAANLVDVIISAITGVLANIVTSISIPFIDALKYFITATPLMAANPGVFKLWLTIVGITDTIFVLVIALLGFRLMSFSTIGLDEIEFKHLLPQVGLIFLLANTSIFAIDGIISLSNAMIRALNSVFSPISVWTTLTNVANQANILSIAALLIMVFFLILVVCLLVYYVGRLVALYLGAVLSPLICVLWLVPGFKDFAENAAKVYLATIFVLFIHVVILQLASSIFAGLALTGPNHSPDPIMALIVGLATILALLKTQGLLMQLSYVSIGPKTVRKLGSQFITGISYATTKSSGNFALARHSVDVSASRSHHFNTFPKTTNERVVTASSGRRKESKGTEARNVKSSQEAKSGAHTVTNSKISSLTLTKG